MSDSQTPAEGNPAGSDAQTPEPPAARGPDRRGAFAFAGVMVIVIAVVVGVLVLGGDDGGSSGTEIASACEPVDDPGGKEVDLRAPDAKAPTASKVVFNTNCGSFTVTLDADRAPKTAASFEYLAAEDVYDGTTFHRIAPGFVIQGGDPAGDGTGGPGYSVEEAPPGSLSYTRGLVAMAKTGAEPPGTSGSQFFVVTAPADAGLGPDFALVGEVTEGMETVLAIEELCCATEDGQATELPSQPVVIETATVED